VKEHTSYSTGTRYAALDRVERDAARAFALAQVYLGHDDTRFGVFKFELHTKKEISGNMYNSAKLPVLGLTSGAFRWKSDMKSGI
jgi:hypothetical protein